MANIHRLAATGDWEGVKQLIEERARAKGDWRGATALHLAAERGKGLILPNITKKSPGHNSRGICLLHTYLTDGSSEIPKGEVHADGTNKAPVDNSQCP